MKVLFLGGGEMPKNLSDWLNDIMKESVIYTEERIDIDFVKRRDPEIIVAYNYKYILGGEVINYPPLGCINLHISYLPWNRGAHPNLWSFLEDTPKGVTIHYINECIDSGDIIVQKEIDIDPEKETLRSSYMKLHEEIQKLFKENWIMIKNSRIKRMPQRGGAVSITSKISRPSNLSLERKDGTRPLKNYSQFINKKITFFPLLQVDKKIIEKIRNWRNSKEIRNYMYNDSYITKEEHQKWYESLKNRENTKVWVVYVGNTPIGIVDLIHLDHKNKITDWGFYIGDKKFKGKGLGKVILYNLMNYVFEKMDIYKMHTSVLENNTVAMNLYKKMGFKKEGRLRKHLLRDNKYIDLFIIGILKEEWNEISSTLKTKYDLPDEEFM